jgi:hypothetical protein
MANRTAEFRLGHLGAAFNSYKYAGPAPLPMGGEQNKFAANYGRRVASSGVQND